MPALEYTKIVVDLPNAEHGMSGEGLWTKHFYDNVYEVHNSPWHSREINYLDLVAAIAPSTARHPEFVRVVKRSGHRTIHIIFLTQHPAVREAVLAKLNELGGTYKGTDRALYAIDFAPEKDWMPALSYLAELQSANVLEHRWSAH